MSGRLRAGAAALALTAIAFGGAPAAAQTLWNDPAFALYRQAVDAFEKKDYAEAIRLADQAIAAYPDHLLAHYLRGEAALASSKWDEAVASFTKVTALYPGSFAAARDLGAAYQQLGRVPEAAKAYQSALALRPEDEDTRIRLAFTFLNGGEPDRALPHLQSLAARDTKSPDVWTALGRLAYGRGDLAACETDFAKAVALRDDGRNWFNLGVVRMRRNNLSGALQAFERAAAHPETQEQARGEIAKIREAMKPK